MKRLFFSAIALAALVACSQAPEVHETAIVAHRGYWKCEAAGNAQNSIASLRCAQEAGFWGSEFDVQITADDSLVVFHDSTIGDIKITENPWSAIENHRLPNGEKIPSLDEYLTQAEKCSATMLVFEIKAATCSERNIYLTDRCIERLKAHGLMDPSKVVFISFCQDVCEHLGKVAPEFMTEILWKAYEQPEQYLENNVMGADLNLSEYFKDSTLCANLQTAGIMTNVWTVDKVEDMETLFNMGVDELTTNVPEQAREKLAAMGLKERKL